MAYPTPSPGMPPRPGNVQDQHKDIHKTLPPQRRAIHSHTEQTMGKEGLQKDVKAAEPQSVGPGISQTPPREQGRSQGSGTYGSSRLSLLEIQTLSISCKDAQVGQRRNNLALPRDAHPYIPAPLPMTGIMQGAAKNPKFGCGRKGLAPAMELCNSILAAGICCQPGSNCSYPAWPHLLMTAPCPVPTTVCCSCWNFRLMFWAQKKPKDPIFSSA